MAGRGTGAPPGPLCWIKGVLPARAPCRAQSPAASTTTKVSSDKESRRMWRFERETREGVSRGVVPRCATTDVLVVFGVRDADGNVHMTAKRTFSGQVSWTGWWSPCCCCRVPRAAAASPQSPLLGFSATPSPLAAPSAPRQGVGSCVASLLGADSASLATAVSKAIRSAEESYHAYLDDQYAGTRHQREQRRQHMLLLRRDRSLTPEVRQHMLLLRRERAQPVRRGAGW